jgi:hypothetical protein
MRRRRWTRTAAVVGLALGASGCGYTLQTSKNPILLQKGVRTIYVAPLQNDTFKPGADNVVYNQLIQVLAAGGEVRLVEHLENADAILRGRVTSASYIPTSPKPSDQLFNPFVAKDQIPLASVASEYTANLSCAFTLERTHPRPGEATVIWTSGFSRAKRFPANNQLGVFGTTGPLINDSEFDRALRDMAGSMMGDLRESMLAMF